MNCKKYKLCLVGLIVLALVFGICFYMRNLKEGQMPADSMLVKNCKEAGACVEKWV